MPSSVPLPSELLHYLSSHRVVICKECRYAIQPAAISRHLKELHHIYRGDRQVYLDYALKLDLANPDDVVLPELHRAPVPFLPIEKGVACGVSGCGHLCVTVKRMKQHWSSVHKPLSANTSDASWRPVNLQTFFRGNQLRYFVVDVKAAPSTSVASATPPPLAPQVSTTPPLLPPLELGDLDLNADSVSSESYHCRMLANHGSKLASAEDHDLLRQFMTSTYASFGETPKGQEAWLTSIMDLAFAHPFLMHGILACAATHLAFLSPPCTANRQRYRLAAAQHHDLALPAFREAIATINDDNCHAILAFSQLLITLTFALEDTDENLLLVRQRGEEELPDWMIVIRGGCTLFHNTWHLVSEGPLKPLLVQEAYALKANEDSEAARCLDHLISFPFPESECSSSPGCDLSSGSSPSCTDQHSSLSSASSPPQISESDLCLSHTSSHSEPNAFHLFESRKETYFAALHLLRTAFLNASALGDRLTVRVTLYLWPAHVSQAYLSLLKIRDPSALVLLAHWAVLLKPLEVSWYMAGFTARLLRYVWRELPASDRCWLQWPVRQLGLSEADFPKAEAVESMVEVNLGVFSSHTANCGKVLAS
jgi:Orsellinic acid/F9775 biosynthesis cluster protein D/Fungal specific transcription factor domain